MDTDDLSEAAYKAIIIESASLHEDLTLQFGLLAEECADENEYLDRSRELASEILKMGPEDLGDIFFSNPPSVTTLRKTVARIVDNIDKVKIKPARKRKFNG